MKKLCLIILLCLPIFCMAASKPDVPLYQAHIDFRDKASLQRGAQLYMNYCLSCHSLKYMRYQRVAHDIGITDKNGQVDKALVEDNLIFTGSSIHDLIRSAINPQDAKEWFGVVPPDLTLETRVRGVNWVYTYLLSFYQDKSRPFGVNNLLFPDVGMPNVLGVLQGVQIPIFHKKDVLVDGLSKKSVEAISHLEIIQQGSMGAAEFHERMNDLVNFLAYIAQPNHARRVHLGFWVVGFLIILLILTYALKKAYWKDIKK